MNIGDVVNTSFSYGHERALGTTFRLGVVVDVKRNLETGDITHLVDPVDEYHEGYWVSPTGGNFSYLTVLENRPDYLIQIADRIRARGYVEKADLFVANAEKIMAGVPV